MPSSSDDSEQPLLRSPQDSQDDTFPKDCDADTAKTVDNLRAWARLIGCCISAAAAGWHDGCIGSLIPYLQVYYGGLSDEQVSLVFIGSVTGYILAALSNVTLNTRLGIGRLVIVGAVIQGIASAIIASRPPFIAIALSYTVAGFGLSIQDAQFNTYVSRLPHASTKLGIVHALYGVGAMASPVFATVMMQAKVAPPLFYFTNLAFCVVTMTVLLTGFGFSGTGSWERAKNSTSENDEANASIVTVISSRAVWGLLLFICIYTGSETTEAGWVVSFLMRERGGGSISGYASAAFYGGLTSSRVILLPLTAWLTERRAVALYVVIALVMQVVIWTSPSFIVDFIAIGACGFVMGPIYPVGLSIITKATPRGYHPGAISLMGTFGQIGSAIFPFMVGSLAETYNIKVLQPVLVSLFITMFLLWQLVPSEVR